MIEIENGSPITAPDPAPKEKHDAGLTTISSKLVDKVGVRLEAFVGSADMTIGEMTALSAGSVVVLDEQLNSVVELRLNGTPVARGELVAVGDRFGVRITEIAQWPE